ncbi:MAG: DNA polymerase III subunit epsilon [Parvibaculaceae bacterium]|nr:DNA polymerase III subunit epsilon [Parvibaculaceae bacterium]
MREIVLDTETTGISPAKGHRLIEIGCVELENHVPTGRVYHEYMNPQRDVEKGAFEVHGLSTEFLSDKPLFADLAASFIEFIGDTPLIIHNAPFDMGFLNSELTRLNHPDLPNELSMDQAIDTLQIARRKYPGAQNSLDALCRRFGVDNSGREKHGALLDSELLAEVYLELVGGRQPGLLEMGGESKASAVAASGGASLSKLSRQTARSTPLPSALTSEEQAAHEEFVASFKSTTLWKEL